MGLKASRKSGTPPPAEPPMERSWALAASVLLPALALLLTGVWRSWLTAFFLSVSSPEKRANVTGTLSPCFRKAVSGESGLGPENSWEEMWLPWVLLSILLGTPAVFLDASEEMELGMGCKVGEGGGEGPLAEQSWRGPRPWP